MVVVKKYIRDYAPFIILAYSLIFSVCSYFEFYFEWYIYLPDLLGYSVFTNLFMLSVYMNKKYCASTKICVIGLILLNVFNLFYNLSSINGVIYDIYLMIIIFIILIIKKM